MDHESALARLALARFDEIPAGTFFSYIEVPEESPTPAIKVQKRVKQPTSGNSKTRPTKIHQLNATTTSSLDFETDAVRVHCKNSLGSTSSHSLSQQSDNLVNFGRPTVSKSSSIDRWSTPAEEKRWKLRRKNKKMTSNPHARFSERPEISNPIPITFPYEMFQHPSGMPPDPDVMMEGYLMKRSSNAFKTWNRRWFQIKDNKLLYSHRSTEYEQPTVMEENLMLCLVRPAPPSVDRVGCFELVTPTRSHLLQADSESLCNDWMRALQRTILALHESDDTSSKPTSSQSDASVTSNGKQIVAPDSSTTFEQIRRVPGNERCADCGSEQPKWVSINLGVVLCIECSGVHRSLGVQVSKVRSLTMDSIDAELRDVLLSLGNTQVNAIFLSHLPSSDVVPPEATETSNRQVREAWIKAKYVERRFSIPVAERARSTAHARQEHLLVRHRASIAQVPRSSSYVDVNSAAVDDQSVTSVTQLDVPHDYSTKRLSSCGSDPSINDSSSQVDGLSWPTIVEAARSGDILILLRAIASGFDLNASHDGTSVLHLATQNGQTAAVEFLLLNGAKINVLDHRLNTPLHLAALEGNTLQVCQLLKRCADTRLKNADGVTPLDIAVEGKHADIVTLFRVHTMRDEFNEEFDNPMNETVDSVISDITRRAAGSKSGSS